MRAHLLRHLLFVLLLVLATGVAAGGAGTTGVRLAAASPSPYLVSRSGTSYRAVSQVTGTTFNGTLKAVVESAVQSLEQSGGGTVSFAAGDFDLGSEFFLLHQIRSITFAGQGMDATVIHNSSDVAADTEPFNFQDTDHVLIRDLTVRAGGALRSTSDAIDFDRGNNSTVERVKITGSRAKGIIFDGKNDSWTSTGNTVRDCVIQNVASNGIEFLASTDNLVEGCTISDVGRTGIEMGKSGTTADQPNKKSSGNTIRNNRIDNAGLNGIYVKSGDRNQILGNTITNSSDDAAGNDGIRISSTDSVSCDGNVVDGNTASDTEAVKTQAYGLRIGSALCLDTTVGTNNFTGNRTGAILDLGTNTHYTAPTADSTAPVTSIACNGGSCGGPFAGPVSVSLSASDAGSGVKATYYTTDGSDPAASATRIAYSAPFTLAASATVRFSSLDNAGNVEPAKSQAVSIGSGGTAGTVTFTPVADAYVSADAPTANYGTSTALRVDGSPVVRSFVRFSLSGLTGSVTSATLRIYANSAQRPGFDVYGVSSTTWSETGITHGSAPALGSKLGSSGTAAAGTWKTVDVTAAVSGNGSYSFALTTTGSTALSLASRESQNKPQLIIQTVGGPTTDSTAPVTSIACNGGSCGGSFTGPVSVSLSASDAGSGVKATSYTTDGSDPTSSATRIAYSAPFTLAGSATVRFSSVDNAGNVEAAKSQTVTIGGGTGGTVTLMPVADAYVSADAPTANYGTSTALRVDGSPVVRSFVRFSLGGLAGSVTSATLRVYANSAQSTGFDVYGVSSTTWSETGITNGSAPALGSKLGSSGTAAAGTWKTVDVTAAVSGNGSYSFALTTTGSTALSLASRESQNKPQLTIQTSNSAAGGTSN